MSFGTRAKVVAMGMVATGMVAMAATDTGAMAATYTGAMELTGEVLERETRSPMLQHDIFSRLEPLRLGFKLSRRAVAQNLLAGAMILSRRRLHLAKSLGFGKLSLFGLGIKRSLSSTRVPQRICGRSWKAWCKLVTMLRSFNVRAEFWRKGEPVEAIPLVEEVVQKNKPFPRKICKKSYPFSKA